MNIMRYMVITVCEKWNGKEWKEMAEYHGTYLTREHARNKLYRMAEENNLKADWYGYHPYVDVKHPRFDGVFSQARGKALGTKYLYDHFIIKPVI